MSAYHIFFSVPLIFKLPLPEPWRFFTAFWLTGKDLSILFDTYFSTLLLRINLLHIDSSSVWTYSSGLERDSGRFTQPGDFFTYTLFVGSVIVVSSRVQSLRPRTYQYFVSSALEKNFETSHTARPAKKTSCSGSISRGRIPLHVPWSPSFAYKIIWGCGRCEHGGIAN